MAVHSSRQRSLTGTMIGRSASGGSQWSLYAPLSRSLKHYPQRPVRQDTRNAAVQSIDDYGDERRRGAALCRPSLACVRCLSARNALKRGIEKWSGTLSPWCSLRERTYTRCCARSKYDAVDRRRVRVWRATARPTLRRCCATDGSYSPRYAG